MTGLPELVDHSQSGFLVPPHDVEALASAIAMLAQSASLRSEFGLAARNKVERHFDSDINVARYRELFRSSGRSDNPMFLIGGPAYCGTTLLTLMLNQDGVTCLNEPDFHNPEQSHNGLPVLQQLYPGKRHS